MLQVKEPTLLDKIEARQAVVGICGLGYVGLPLALTFGEKGFPVIGFDIDARKVTALEKGESYIRHIDAGRIQKQNAREDKGFSATLDFRKAREADVLIMCVPTPLNANREPDMTYIEATARAIGPYVRSGQLVVLESSTYPGTTDEVVKPIVEQLSGLRAGIDFHLAFSPEREDPGNPSFNTATIPKVVGARVRVQHALHRAGGRDQLADAVPRRGPDHRGAQRAGQVGQGRQGADPGARLQEEHRRSAGEPVHPPDRAVPAEGLYGRVPRPVLPEDEGDAPPAAVHAGDAERAAGAGRRVGRRGGHRHRPRLDRLPEAGAGRQAGGGQPQRHQD